MADKRPAPSDETIAASVERVETQLFARLKRPRTNRLQRGVVAGVAGVALFAGGLGVGAAAYASPGAPVPTVAPTPGPSEFAFAIDCYTGPDADEAFLKLGFSDSAAPPGVGLDTARANPAAACQGQLEEYERGRVATQVVDEYLREGTAQCVVLSIAGAEPFYTWKTLQDPATHENVPFWSRAATDEDEDGYSGSYTKPDGYPADCAEVVRDAPGTSSPELGACAVDAQHAAVYVLGNKSAAEVCAANDYKVWPS